MTQLFFYTIHGCLSLHAQHCVVMRPANEGKCLIWDRTCFIPASNTLSQEMSCNLLFIFLVNMWRISNQILDYTNSFYSGATARHRPPLITLATRENRFLLYHYAPNFEEVDRAYWFRVVRVCVRASIRQEPCMLGFWNFIYGFLMEK